jgi:transcriptional regulator with XRE-family HTH domain
MGRRAAKPDDGLEFDYAKLRARRRMLDLSQRGLAVLVGAHANAVLAWEKGRGEGPSLEQFVRAARVLGTPLNELFDVWDKEGRSAKPRKNRG